MDNKNTLQTLISKEYNKLNNYVKKYFDERYEGNADDIIQDVALNVFTKINLDKPIENIIGYFYKAIRFKIIDIQRKPQKNVSLEQFTNDKGENNYFSDDLEETPEHNNGFGDILTEYDENDDSIPVDNEALMEAIRQLPPDEQELIIETEIYGTSFKELSEETGKPVGTLLSKKHRALKKLNKILTTKKQNYEIGE